MELPAAATVADLRRKLTRSVPALAGLIDHLQFAVDAEYASDATPIPPNSDLACIPPVSGG